MPLMSSASAWQVFYLVGAEDVDKFLPTVAAEGFDSAFISPGPVTYQIREQIGDAARQYRVPTVADQDVYARAGALLSYGVDVNTVFVRAAEYIDKILRGARPADLRSKADQVSLDHQRQDREGLGLTCPAVAAARR